MKFHQIDRYWSFPRNYVDFNSRLSSSTSCYGRWKRGNTNNSNNTNGADVKSAKGVEIYNCCFEPAYTIQHIVEAMKKVSLDNVISRMGCYHGSKIIQRRLHSSHQASFLLEESGCNRPTPCSEPLRYKDGGPSKVSPDCAGWDRLGKGEFYNLQLIVYS